jgi:hypothetical protein
VKRCPAWRNGCAEIKKTDDRSRLFWLPHTVRIDGGQALKRAFISSALFNLEQFLRIRQSQGGRWREISHLGKRLLKNTPSNIIKSSK